MRPATDTTLHRPRTGEEAPEELEPTQWPGRSGSPEGLVLLVCAVLLLIFALGRSGKAVLAPAAVGAYIGAAYWFTSSTSFANPAVTIGRAFTDTFAGIAPASVPGFVIAQLVGLLTGAGLLLALYPTAGETADDIVVERSADQPSRAV